MIEGLFLVARVAADSLGETLEWLGSDEPPFQPMDPLDFLSSAEVVAVYDLYRTQYLRLDARLNIGTPEACWNTTAGSSWSTDPGVFWPSRASRRRNMG